MFHPNQRYLDLKSAPESTHMGFQLSVTRSATAKHLQYLSNMCLRAYAYFKTCGHVDLSENSNLAGFSGATMSVLRRLSRTSDPRRWILDTRGAAAQTVAIA
jgi:hypothetical protein